jgi:hypothetical protein
MAGMLQFEYGKRAIRAYNLEPGMVLSQSFVACMADTDLMELGIPRAPVEFPAAVKAWLCSDPEAAEFAGQNVHAQPFCARRGLLPDWLVPEDWELREVADPR